jgi:hypothetical protein
MEVEFLIQKKYIVAIGMIATIAFMSFLLVLSNAGDDPLKGTSWTRMTEVDSEIINFNSDGHFAYYYGVGSPVDDYDLYDAYNYDPETQTITLKSVADSEDRTLKVVSLEDNKLVLIIDTEERTFNKTNN